MQKIYGALHNLVLTLNRHSTKYGYVAVQQTGDSLT